MSIRATAWAWTVEAGVGKDITVTAKFVLLALAEHADETGLCWPSVPRLAAMTGLTERAVYEALPALETAKLIQCSRRTGRPTRYWLRINSPAEPLNRIQGYEARTPERHSGVTPEPRSGDPCTRFRGGVNHVQGTPEPRSPEPSRTVIEPPVNRQSGARSPNGSRLPDDWRPSDADEAFATALGLDPHRIADSFRDYWLAQPGARGRKTDWPATWRNWCRRDAERRPGAAPKPSKMDWLVRDMLENP